MRKGTKNFPHHKRGRRKLRHSVEKISYRNITARFFRPKAHSRARNSPRGGTSGAECSLLRGATSRRRCAASVCGGTMAGGGPWPAQPTPQLSVFGQQPAKGGTSHQRHAGIRRGGGCGRRSRCCIGRYRRTRETSAAGRQPVATAGGGLLSSFAGLRWLWAENRGGPYEKAPALSRALATVGK